MGIMGYLMGTKKGGRRRFWSDDEKRSICLQTCAPGVSVAQVARRYAMNANLIHTWLRDPRFALADDPSVSTVADDVTFLPVELESAELDADRSSPSHHSGLEAPLSAQRVDITLSDGRRILIEGTTALSAVLALVEGLMP